ncbi:hypothetical protein ABPG74_014405 [Tetrahymena malaccensis]
MIIDPIHDMHSYLPSCCVSNKQIKHFFTQKIEKSLLFSSKKILMNEFSSQNEHIQKTPLISLQLFKLYQDQQFYFHCWHQKGIEMSEVACEIYFSMLSISKLHPQIDLEIYLHYSGCSQLN